MSKIVPLEGFGGGGSSSLNFKIVAYATEEELAAAQPKENTIGVVTTTPINGWSFNATEPTELMEGMVWFTTGTSSSVAFNAFKKNDIQVYPISAKQYISGTWVDKTAKSWQNGEWVEWIVYLYNEGDRCEDLTGSWEANANMKLNGTANKPANVTFNETSITTKLASVCIANTVNKINVTPYSTLNFYVDVQETAGSDTYGIIADYGDIYKNCAACLINTKTAGLQTISIDISNIEGEYYVAWGSSNRIRVMHKVWLS